MFGQSFVVKMIFQRHFGRKLLKVDITPESIRMKHVQISMNKIQFFAVVYNHISTNNLVQVSYN